MSNEMAARIGSVEPLDRLLFGAIIFLVLVLVVVAKWSPNDGQTFQVISGLLTTFSGAFVGRMVPSKKDQQGEVNSTTGGAQ